MSELKIVTLYVLHVVATYSQDNNYDQALTTQYIENDVVALTDEELIEAALEWWAERTSNA